mmetsp:Transcript_28010/g.82329  ORF Transcript_28010/g.82329 Transcript_28010/m.82329 type:complete len:153 (+) Transcript_28010:14-472(+)
MSGPTRQDYPHTSSPSLGQRGASISSNRMDDDEDLPLNVPGEKPKAPDGVHAFQLGHGQKSGAELFEEENAAVAGEEVTVILQMPDKEVPVQMKMGHTVELLKLKLREHLEDLSLNMEMRLADSDQVMIDPLSLNDYPITAKSSVKVKVTLL